MLFEFFLYDFDKLLECIDAVKQVKFGWSEYDNGRNDIGLKTCVLIIIIL